VRIRTGIGEYAVSRTLGQHDLADDEIENATQLIETDTLVAELNAPSTSSVHPTALPAGETDTLVSRLNAPSTSSGHPTALPAGE